MPKINTLLFAMNRGLVSPMALPRVDVERVRLSAETYTNWMAKTQGPMYLRPGMKYLGSSRNNLVANYLDFVAATDDTALIEVTNAIIRIWMIGGDPSVVTDDETLLTRPAVSTTISNSNFATSTDWVTSGSTGGGTCTFGADGLVLNAVNRGGLAKCTRQITNSSPNVEHALAINVTRGTVTFRCGSSAGGEEYISETSLGTGRHSLAFTPTGNFHLTISSDDQVDRIVASLAIEAAGVVELVSPWGTADLPKLRWVQSADVMFVACDGYKQRRIERRGTGRSWSVVHYESLDGPFKAVRSAKVRLKPSVTFGNGTLTSDLAFFKTTHVGAIFRLFHPGYHGVFNLGREDTFTNPIRVTGVNVSPEEDPGPTSGYSDRSFSFAITGTWTGTLTLQRSFDDPDSGYLQFRGMDTSASPHTFSTVDQDDNAIVYYRVGFLVGDYASGAATVTANYSGGGDFGICRVTRFTSATEVDIEVLKDFSGTDYTEDWREGLWSERSGWPTEVTIYEGRLWWFGNVYIAGSVSDAYDSFDAEVEGDSGPIVRTIGSGPVDVVNFALPLQRLVFGTASAEVTLKSSSFDEPLTPQAFGARDAETQGSANLRAAKVGKQGVFVQRSRKRVFELVFSGDVNDYDAKELTLLNPDITGSASIAGVAVQRQPDTRIHFWLNDGTVIICTYEPKEEVLCWSRVTNGFVTRICVLPGEEEDRVYYLVRRVIDGAQVRYLEKWALESECKGGTNNFQLDSYGTVAGPVSTVTGALHLKGQTVAVWANGQCLENTDGTVKTFIVSPAGEIALGASYSNITYGFQYTADFKSSKLAYAAGMGTALTQKKRAAKVGVILGTAHYKGLRYSATDFQHLDYLPLVKDGTDVPAHTVFTEYDEQMVSLNARWDTDSRLYLRAAAPRPCELLAVAIQVETHDS